MWLDVYQYRKAITIDHTKFGSGLTDFPLLVKLTDSNFDFSKSLTSGGLDIRFTDSDGDSLLKFEREFFGTVYGDTFCVDGTASASSIFGGSYTAPNAFDGNSSTVWESASGGGMPQWVKYDLGVGVTKIARQFSVMTWFADRNSPPTDFVLQGSNNDSSWTDLYTKTGETWTDAGPKFYQFANATAYRYYRLYVTATLGASYTSVKELQIMELVNEAYFWVKVPSISSTIDGTIYLYYGKSGDTDGQDASNTWDDFNKAIYHLQQSGNGTAGEFIDSKNSHDGHGAWDNSVGRTPILVDSHLDGAQYFNFAQEIIIPDNSDMELAEDDFTISFKTQFFSLSNAGLIWIGRYQGPSGYFYCGFELASGNNFRFRDFLGSSIDFLFAWTPIVGHYYDIEITRNGNLFTFYADGIQIATYSNSDALLDRTSDWQFGNVFGVVSSDNYAFNGIMDEIRWTVGLCRSDSWRDARIASDNDTVNTFENEEGFGISIAETVVIRENWNLETNPSEKAFSDTLSIQEAWFAFTNPVQKSISDTIKIADSWTVNAAGSVIKIFSTILNTVFRSVTLFATNLTLGQVQFIKYLTNLVTKVGINYTYNTDLRCKTTPFDIIAVGTLDDYSINLDGIPLNSKDVDFQSINITFNLNSTPSRAEMTLPRHHDNLNYKLDGSFSEITNENKIEIYDGSIKLFTGYVTQIFADSNKDVVTITVEDIRYKLALSSMQLEYGGDWLIDSNNNGIPDIDDNDHAVVNDPNYIRFEKSISKALDEVFLHIGVLISGHDAYPFSGTFVPEFVKTFDTYAALIDELLKNTANVNWYTDENEIVRFQVVAKGQIKTLDLSSINSHRHPYDTVINDIRLNKKQSNYATALNVKLGNHIIKFWSRQEFSGIINSIPDFFNSPNCHEKTIFDFQQWGDFGLKFYVGINQTIYGFYTTTGWVLKPTIVIQWLNTDRSFELNDINVGTGEPVKRIYLTSYGIKEVNVQWEEKIRPRQEEVNGGGVVVIAPEVPYLTYITEESYNRVDFATDLAKFELSQNNKLLTAGTIEILLDAYEYYNIKFSDLINLSNTIGSNIYNNNNGFPLNIQSMTINLGRRTVSLSVTNYGKSAYVKTENYMKNYYAPTIYYAMVKMPVQKYTDSGT